MPRQSPLVVFIARNAAPAVLERREELARAGYDAHVVVDEVASLSAAPRDAPALRSCIARVHSIDEAEARRLHWTCMTGRFFHEGRRDVTGWEKATLWALAVLRADAASATGGGDSTCGVEARDAWFVEDDVWWPPGGDGLTSLLATRSCADLIASRLAPTVAHRPEWYNWGLNAGVIPPPFLSASFNPVSRVSLRVLEAAATLAATAGRLTFHEILFPSLVRMIAAGGGSATAAHAEWFAPQVERGIRWRPAWGDSELSAAMAVRGGARLFHPVKHTPGAPTPPPLTCDDAFKSAVREQLRAFAASGTAELAFSSTLGSEQRRSVHEVAEELGLTSQSSGEGAARVLIVALAAGPAGAP